MKYPLDPITYNEFITHIISHSNMQTVIIQKLFEIIDQANASVDPDSDDMEWQTDAADLKRDLASIKTDHENRRWNEANYNAQMNAGAYKAPPRPVVAADTKELAVIEKEGLQPGKVERIARDDSHIVGLPTAQFDERLNAKANVEEAKFGPEMSEEELARHFAAEPRPAKKVFKYKKEKTLDTMTMEEIEDWEAKQNNSNDIYKVAARIKNLARGGNASLTPQGDMLCNSFTHVLMALYDFADKVQDKTVKIKLTELIRGQEGMPGNIIAAAGAGVKTKK